MCNTVIVNYILKTKTCLTLHVPTLGSIIFVLMVSLSELLSITCDLVNIYAIIVTNSLHIFFNFLQV